MSLLHTESTDGRDKTLSDLRQIINPLTLVEPDKPPQEEDSAPPSKSSGEFSSSYSSSSSSASEAAPSGPPPPLPALLPPPPGQPGQSLVFAHDEVYYRAKAAAVLWLLRSITGDAPLKRALQTYRDEVRQAGPDAPEDPRAFQRVLEAASQKNLSDVFDDWVYHDRGLADLSIVNVTPRDLPARNGKGVSWLVAVEVHNAGYVNVDVPVTVRSGTLTATERIQIPARSSASTRILFEGVPQEVQLNDGTVPEITAPFHTRELHINPAPTQ